jgi:hypothetical protein
MLTEAIAKILSLAEPNIVDVDDRQYTDKALLPIKEPEPTRIHIHTLGGLCDWIGADNHEDLILQVVGTKRVDAISKLGGQWEQRNNYVCVEPPRREQFPMGNYMPIEEFIIGFQCNFVPSENKARIIKALASIKSSEVITSEDDGLSQKVGMENEIQRLEERTLEPMIALAPYRTFTEVTQPESLFLLRLKQRKNELPSVALFEADGGAWRNVAITNIADFLKENPIVKEKKIPVIS